MVKEIKYAAWKKIKIMDTYEELEKEKDLAFGRYRTFAAFGVIFSVASVIILNFLPIAFMFLFCSMACYIRMTYVANAMRDKAFSGRSGKR